MNINSGGEVGAIVEDLAGAGTPWDCPVAFCATLLTVTETEMLRSLEGMVEIGREDKRASVRRSKCASLHRRVPALEVDRNEWCSTGLDGSPKRPLHGDSPEVEEGSRKLEEACREISVDAPLS